MRIDGNAPGFAGGIMMRVWHGLTNLPKNGGTVQIGWNVGVNWLLESEFCPWKHAYRGFRIIRRAKAARASAEVAGDQFVRDLGWPRLNMQQTIIAHEISPSDRMAFVDDNSAAFGLLLSHQTDLVARYNRASCIRDWVFVRRPRT